MWQAREPSSGWPAGGGTPSTVLDEPAMSQKHATGQKTTGMTNIVDVENHNPPDSETLPFDNETRYTPAVAGEVVDL
jgi:hypothetical protein